MVRELLWVHLRFVRNHLERDVGGNHLLKNLKAWLALALFFGQKKDIERACRAISKQLSIQVLPDGGHFERAPAYHVQVLTDLIDLQKLLFASGDSHLLPELDQYVASMRFFLQSLVDPAGAVVLLNDGFPVDPQLLEVLGVHSASPTTAFSPNSGVARLVRGPWTVFMDVGDPCPPELPAHAHADTLSCIVYFEEERIIGEAFTSTYEASPQRQYERSTQAHSTIQINGADSTEVWASFRAGRRARVDSVDFHASVPSISASHDGYRFIKGSPKHWRKVSVSDDGLTIVDEVSTSHPVSIALNWHVPIGVARKEGSLTWTVGNRLGLTIETDLVADTGEAKFAEDFGKLKGGKTIRVHGRINRSARIVTTISQVAEAS
jgi:uncharacterized heparinase superfamily protein